MSVVGQAFILNEAALIAVVLPSGLRKYRRGGRHAAADTFGAAQCVLSHLLVTHAHLRLNRAMHVHLEGLAGCVLTVAVAFGAVRTVLHLHRLLVRRQGGQLYVLLEGGAAACCYIVVDLLVFLRRARLRERCFVTRALLGLGGHARATASGSTSVVRARGASRFEKRPFRLDRLLVLAQLHYVGHVRRGGLRRRGGARHATRERLVGRRGPRLRAVLALTSTERVMAILHLARGSESLRRLPLVCTLLDELVRLLDALVARRQRRPALLLAHRLRRYVLGKVAQLTTQVLLI